MDLDTIEEENLWRRDEAETGVKFPELTQVEVDALDYQVQQVGGGPAGRHLDQVLFESWKCYRSGVLQALNKKLRSAPPAGAPLRTIFTKEEKLVWCDMLSWDEPGATKAESALAAWHELPG
ncbi:MAG: hypothetical protein M1832_001550 [Thelocarpon impressellum]|nr:MAG: hypothetical protein M1832_001550 [Thelocarpon impressellum]